ncbi:MAG TPA: hypothetical protein VMV33_14345 [Rhodocyclaceae bacterium]|nr:hypothetical protein [Rhodocyclaceae bacterium]
MLIDAVIGVLIMSIVGAGTAYVASRVEVGSRDLRAGNIAITHMRELLHQYGPSLCPDGANHGKAQVTMPDGSSHSLQVTCTAMSAATVAGLTVKQPTAVTLCTKSSDKTLFGAVPVSVANGPATACGEP